MRKLKGKILIAWLMGAAAACVPSQWALGGESSARASEPTRVGGTYEVTKIEKKERDHFIITFESVAKTGRYDTLVLESDHVHVGIKQGEKLRLSAEILSETGSKAEIEQVLLFLPVDESHVPVWMLSRKARGLDLRGSKYLEMHAPTSDYLIF